MSEEKKGTMEGFFKTLSLVHEQVMESRRNLEKLQTNPPNMIDMVDCCHSCNERYMDDSEASMSCVFCTKHNRWVKQIGKCDDFNRIAKGRELGEGTEEAHAKIRELINKNAW